MKIFKSKKIGSLVVATFAVFSFAVAAGGNGNGNEPAKNPTTGDSSFICSVLPFMCPVTNGGNGNGNEPA